MKQTLIAIAILFCSCSYGQFRNYVQFDLMISDNGNKLLLSIDGKDTVIRDTMALVRYFLAEQKRSADQICRYHDQLWRSYELLNQINGVMIQEPKRKQHFKL